jgi:hypothetical protein
MISDIPDGNDCMIALFGDSSHCMISDIPDGNDCMIALFGDPILSWARAACICPRARWKVS